MFLWPCNKPTAVCAAAGCWCRRPAACSAQLCSLYLLASLLWGWVRALPSRHVTPRPLRVSAYSFSPPSRAVLFLKATLSKFILLLWRRDALCLNLGGGVFEELQRAALYVSVCLHLHHRTNNPSLTPLFISLHPFKGLKEKQNEERSKVCQQRCGNENILSATDISVVHSHFNFQSAISWPYQQSHDLLKPTEWYGSSSQTLTG